MDSNLLWACKMVLLDQLDQSKILKEVITYKEKDELKNFIRNLNSEQAVVILEGQGSAGFWGGSEEELKDILGHKGEVTPEYREKVKKFREKIKKHGEEFNKSHRSKVDAAFKKYEKERKETSEETDKKLIDLAKELDIEKREAAVDKEAEIYKKHYGSPKSVGVLIGKSTEIKTRQKLGQRLGLPAKIAIGLGIATLLAIGAYYIYKRYKDECRRRCKFSTDPNCLKKCRETAARTSIAKLEGTKSACGSDQRCIMKADKEIRKWHGKLTKIEHEDVSWGVLQKRRELAAVGKLHDIPKASYVSGRPKPPAATGIRRASYIAGTKSIM